MSNLFIRLTHTGIFPGGRPNAGPVLIQDLDVGYEFQHRKVSCYVPFGGHIDIPASSKSLLSFDTGVIFKATTAGLITSKLYFQPDVYSNVTRPAATDFPAGASIWNTDDNALNWSDGAGGWRDYAGNLT